MAPWEIRCILQYYLKNIPQSSPDSFLTSGSNYEIKPRLYKISECFILMQLINTALSHVTRMFSASHGLDKDQQTRN